MSSDEPEPPPPSPTEEPPPLSLGLMFFAAAVALILLLGAVALVGYFALSRADVTGSYETARPSAPVSGQR